MKTYGIINLGYRVFTYEMHKAEKENFDFQYDYVFQSHDLDETLEKLLDLKADDFSHVVEVFESTFDFEFLEGSDFDGAGNFLRRNLKNRYNMLVSFSKGRELQYHVFTDCTTRLSFIHDPIFKSAMKLGFSWSAIPYDESILGIVGCTYSTCEEVLEND